MNGRVDTVGGELQHNGRIAVQLRGDRRARAHYKCSLALAARMHITFSKSATLF